MLQRNRASVGDHGIHYVLADVFEWDPAGRFDDLLYGTAKARTM
jgi:hypothetical protein